MEAFIDEQGLVGIDTVGSSMGARMLAAVAERHDIPVLHYDRDFDVVAEVTGQPVEWVVQPGTAD